MRATRPSSWWRLLRDHVDGRLETLLELGSGGGEVAMYLKGYLRPDVDRPVAADVCCSTCR